MESNGEESLNCTPEDIVELATTATMFLLPEKSTEQIQNVEVFNTLVDLFKTERHPNVFFVFLETLSAQEGYNYPAPSRKPILGNPERPAEQGKSGRPETKPVQTISAFPNNGFSTGISGQELPGSSVSNGYPGRGRPSGQEFPSRPQGKKNGFSKIPGTNQQGISNQQELTPQEYPSQTYPSSSTSDQRYPSTSDKPQSRPGISQSYPDKPIGSQSYPNQENYSGAQNYPEQGGYPKQQEGFPNKQRGSSRGYPGEQRGYSEQQEGLQGYPGPQGNSQELPSKQAKSQRYPSQQNIQSYPGEQSAGYKEQQRAQGQNNRGQPGSPDYREQQQGNIPEQGQSLGQFPERGGLSEQQVSAFDEDDYSAIPGEPDKDYPILSEIPQTSFSCDQQQYPGYYADVETRCQVFHVCANNLTYDFLCPNGTIFHQEYLVCVWWNQFNCDSAPSLYEVNANIYDYSIIGGQGLSSGVGETDGAGYPEDVNQGSPMFDAQRPGGYPIRPQEQGYSPKSPNKLSSGYSDERTAGTRPSQPSGSRAPSSSFQQGYPSGSQESSTGYPSGRVPEEQVISGGYQNSQPSGSRAPSSSFQQGYPSGSQESSAGYPSDRVPEEQVINGGYQNGIQDKPGRVPIESVENQRPQYPKNRPNLTPRPLNQKPSTGVNGFSNLEPGFPNTASTETSSQEGRNGYSNGRPGTSFPEPKPQGPTQGYLPPFP
ncbi:uncharacterized protein LOC130447117 [Diorhabda sublineata]|uniref:uncharacterized protein LOC130447117 n=1 Tax=Diorhabda sublineata TaxID=1163346 RepID=UPI0024E053BD|nr:uncharacterized protein LOC130447117 [Diorhabda sublineata]